MSKLLKEIIKERKANAVSYEEYLKKIAALANKVSNPAQEDLPESIKKAMPGGHYTIISMVTRNWLLLWTKLLNM